MTLIEQSLLERLHPREVRFFSQIGSTNDEALDWLAKDATSGSVVVADEQVAGKGRLGRVWHTPPGTALIVSVVLRPSAEYLSKITMLGAVAIYDMVKGLGADYVGIKWPNDVLLNGLKVSGILPEAIWENGQLVGVVLGMGINVRIDFSDTPLAGQAISLETILGRHIDRLDLLADLLGRIDYWYEHLNTRELFETWQSRLDTIGQTVRIQTADKEVVGLAQSVDHDGALLVLNAHGQVQRVIAGDIALG